MVSDIQYYNLFDRFVEAYTPIGFIGIDRHDPLVVELEALTCQNNQFFHVADLIQARIVWSSKGCTEMIGVTPEELNAYHFFEATHPDDIQKHTLGRAKMFSLANDLYKAEKGIAYLSINLRIRNSRGEYPDLLFQLYFFYSEIPYKTVFLLQVHTNIESFKKRKFGYHYFVGHDLSNFRYPDQELLMIGTPLSDREFEIVKLVEAGLNSQQIADKLFLSVYTVNTHRANILEKTGKPNISELIFEYQKIGLI